VEGKNTYLGKLVTRAVKSKVNFDEAVSILLQDTKKQYQEMIDRHQSVLGELSKSLTVRLQHWSHPGTKVELAWTQDEKKSVQIESPIAQLIAGEGSFNGSLARFGHGLQRSCLIALLQELSIINDV